MGHGVPVKTCVCERSEQIRVYVFVPFCLAGFSVWQASLTVDTMPAKATRDTAGDHTMTDPTQDSTQPPGPLPGPCILRTPAAVQAREAFNRWSATAYQALTRSGSHTEELDHWMISQWEAIAESAVEDHQIRALAEACNMEQIETAEFVAVLGAYCGRKALRMDYMDGTFHEAPPTITDLPATARAQEQRINELTAALQKKDAELEKARVPRAPPLTAARVNDLASTRMRFQWMNTLLSAMQGLQQVPLNAQDWTQDVFVQKVWCLLHLEMANKRQSRGTPVREQAATAQSGGSVEVINNSPAGQAHTEQRDPQRDSRKPGRCFKCHQMGHWAADCPAAVGQGYLIHRDGKEFWMSATGVEWDTSEPPPGNCTKCGQRHWSHKPTATCSGRVVRQVQAQATTSDKVEAWDDAIFENMVNEFRQAAGSGPAGPQ